MSDLVTRSPLSIGLAALAGLGALLFALSLAPTLIATPGVPTPRTLTDIDPPQIDPMPVERYAVIAERPLFSADRRTETSAAMPGTGGGTPSLADYRLMGVVVSKETRLALVERLTSHQVVTLHPGDDLDGRHVEDISADGVVLRDPNGVTTLSIPKPKGGGWSYSGGSPISP